MHTRGDKNSIYLANWVIYSFIKRNSCMKNYTVATATSFDKI